MKTFVLGDIHGAYKALMQVIEKSKIDYKNDILISLGDTADGWPDVPKCFDELLKFKNLIYILGNHDKWLLEYFKYGLLPDIWVQQGGQASLDAYWSLTDNKDERINKHRELLTHALPYYHDSHRNYFFVHGGFDWHQPLEEHTLENFIWDRQMFSVACMWERQNKNLIKKIRFPNYKQIFIGHTATSHDFPDMKPVHVSNLWNLDQGAGWRGKLTLMNIDTFEYFQSDEVNILYPGIKGR